MTRKANTTTPQRPTITDEEYKDLLAIRLGTQKGFDAKPPTVTEAEKNRARAEIRNARKVRKAQAEIIRAWNAFQTAQEEAKVAAAAAKPKRVRKPKVTVTESVTPDTESDLPTTTQEFLETVENMVNAA